VPTISYKEHLESLLPLAERQEGYFTTEQARGEGVQPPALARLAVSRHLDREHHGVYRISRWPGSKHPGLWPALLWASRRSPLAALSHRTALELHGVSDLNADRIDVTVPREVRVRSLNPPSVVVHQRDLTEKDVETIDGLRVTTLYRTLLDLAVDRIAQDEVAGILDEPSRVVLSESQLRQVRALYDLSAKAREHLINAVGVPIGQHGTTKTKPQK